MSIYTNTFKSYDYEPGLDERYEAIEQALKDADSADTKVRLAALLRLKEHTEWLLETHREAARVALEQPDLVVSNGHAYFHSEQYVSTDTVLKALGEVFVPVAYGNASRGGKAW